VWKSNAGPFDDTLTKTSNELEAQKQQLTPAFVMVDPFGISGTPMPVLTRILANPKSENLRLVHVRLHQPIPRIWFKPALNVRPSLLSQDKSSDPVDVELDRRGSNALDLSVRLEYTAIVDGYISSAK
jgi:hypothetical protein